VTKGGFPSTGSTLALSGELSTRDSRRARLHEWVGGERHLVRIGIDGLYDYRPNRRFYGVGNFSDRDRRAGFLGEESAAEGILRVGRDDRLELHGIAGY